MFLWIAWDFLNELTRERWLGRNNPLKALTITSLYSDNSTENSLKIDGILVESLQK